MCYPAGEKQLSSCIRLKRRIDYSDVAGVWYAHQKSKFIIRLIDGREFNIVLSVDGSPGVREAFRLQLGVRYWEAPSGTWVHPTGDIQLATPPTPGKPRTGRRPGYSQLAGWTLKLIGLLYWLLLSSPITDSWLSQGDQSNSRLWLLLYLPAPTLIYLGYQLCQRPRDTSSNLRDPRKPILFLRPFLDDAATTLQPPGLIAAIAGIRGGLPGSGTWARRRDGGRGANTAIYYAHPIQMLRMLLNYGTPTSEESIVRFFKQYGPLVALGKPGERLATPGSTRIYSDDDQWHGTVQALLRTAQAVVIQPGLTTGIRWELEQVHELVPPPRVLLALVGLWKQPQPYSDLASHLRSIAGVELPRVVPHLDRPVFVSFGTDWSPRIFPLSYRSPAMWPLAGDAADLPYTLQPFLQGMSGFEPEPPRRPRWTGGFGTFIATLAAVPIALLVAAVPVMGAHYLGASIFHLASEKPGLSTDAEVVQLVRNSPQITLRGVATNYSLEVPDAMLKIATKPGVEYARITPDRRLIVVIAASKQFEDLTGLAATSLEALKREGLSDAKLVSVRTIQAAEADWVEISLIGHRPDGLTFRAIARGTSDEHRTVVVSIFLVDLPDRALSYGDVADRIWHSVDLRPGK